MFKKILIANRGDCGAAAAAKPHRAVVRCTTQGD
jgi:hypothetical protein